MISRFLHSLLALGLVMTSQLASAGAPVSKELADKIKAALDNPAMGLSVGTVSTSVLR